MAISEHMTKPDYWLVLSTPDEALDQATLNETLPSHLDWMKRLEVEGLVLLSGPLVSGPDAAPGSGATVLRAADSDAATQLAEQDPLFRAGLRTFTVHQWRINEGSVQMRMLLGTGHFEWQ